MQLILLERVEKLGQMGQVVNVKTGFARNFLLPKKKALRATKQNLTLFENKRVEFEATNLKLKSEAEVVSQKMNGVMVSLIRQASEMGHLYGSVRAGDIVVALDEAGYKVSRGQIQIDVPIKNLGLHKVRVLLHPEVSVTVQVNVAQSEEEAVVQAAGGSAGEGETSPVAAESAEAVPAKKASAAKSKAKPKAKKEEEVEAPEGE